MLAIATADALHWVAPSVLKNPPESLTPSLEAPEIPSAIGWALDNTTLFLAHSTTIYCSHPEDVSLLFSLDAGSPPISHLVCSESANTLIFSTDQSVHVLEDISTSPRVSRTLGAHKLAVRSLSLSYERSLLASTTADAAHVHNLALGSHTILRGLPFTPSATHIAVCAFHKHIRTRLLLGIGRQLAVYDTTRPSSPVKVISTGEAEVSFIACSPFSKTLVAVASTSGVLCLTDLEKEKGLVRTIHLSTPLTSLAFSPEGSALYLGTEDGRLLVQNLRELDKAPKSVTVGARVVALAVQKKLKSVPESKVVSAVAKSTAVNPSRKASSSRARPAASEPGPSSPRSAALARVRPVPSLSSGSSLRSISRETTPAKAGTRPAQGRVGSANSTPTAQRSRKIGDRASPATTALSPIRDRLGNLGRAQDFSAESPPALVRRAALAKKDNLTGSPLAKAAKSPLAERTRTAAPVLSVVKRTRTASSSSKTAAAKPSRPEPSYATSADSSATTSPSATARPRTAASSRSGTTSSDKASVSRSTSAPESSPPTTPPRSPEPLPPVALPVTPLAKGRARAPPAAVVSDSLSPPVAAWAAAAAPDVRKVGFAQSTLARDRHEPSNADSERVEDAQPTPTLAMQISPRRAGPAAWNPSPLRSTSHGTGLGAAGAQDLLRTLVRDALADVRQESRDELVGLRLDLLNLGRSWRRELRDGLGGLAEEVRLLREENERLREENARLRRGY